MRCLVVVVALALAQACDAPWAGPSLPAGGHWVSFASVPSEGPIAVRDGIFAATSTTALEAAVGASGYTIKGACRQPCWRVYNADQPGLLYLAVVTTEDRCDTTVKEAAAVSGRTLYFIHWIGDPNGSRCDAALAARWRVLSVSLRDLPGPGTLTVRLQLRGYYGDSAVESQVELT